MNWVDSLLAQLFRGVPYVEASISRDRLRLRWLRSGNTFDEPPVIAIEHKKGRQYVYAVGGRALAADGIPDVTIHNPFESVEPLLSERDLCEALFKHAIREVFEAGWFIAPRLTLFLADRSTQLSNEEVALLGKFADSCAISVLYVFLAGQESLAEGDYTHKRIKRLAHATIKSRH